MTLFVNAVIEKHAYQLYPEGLAPAHKGDAGIDLRAVHDATLYPGDELLMRTGIRIAIPFGYVGLVFPRSGLATKYRIVFQNLTGVIDAPYRGELKIPLWHRGTEYSDPTAIQRGDRIGQLVIIPCPEVKIQLVNELDVTERNDGGFGSTGIR